MFKLNSNIKHLSIGARGEKAAKFYLKSLNYSIIETNFCNQKGRRLGEIDIIAKDGEEIVFIEVKTLIKTSNRSILPEANITHAKLYKLNKIASFYISSKRLYSIPYRFDAVSIVASPEQSTAQIRHLKNIYI